MTATAATPRSKAMPIETELLLLTAGLAPSEEAADRVRQIATSEVNWQGLLTLARHHHVAPLLRHNLAALCWEHVPDDVQSALDLRFAANTRLNLYLLSSLTDIVRNLDAAQVPVICLKGPTLGLIAYGRLSLRQAGDLDLLIAGRDVQAADDVLRSCEFVPAGKRPALQTPSYRWLRELLFVRDRDAVSVDLHWNAADQALSLPLELDDLSASRKTVSAGGTDLPSLTPEALLLVLAVHGATHCWARLRWICDVDALTRTTAIDWDWLFGEAERLRIRRMVVLALIMARDLLGTSYSAEVAARIRVDGETRDLVTRVRTNLLFSPGSEPALRDQLDFRVRSLDRTADGVRLALRMVADPQPADWDALPLPSSMYPVYRLFRPLRLAYRFRTGALSHLDVN